MLPYVASDMRNEKFLTGDYYEENQIPILKLLNKIGEQKCEFICGDKVKYPVRYQKHNFLALYKQKLFLLKRLIVKSIHIPKI